MNVIKAIENEIESKLSLIEHTKQEIKQLLTFKEKSTFYLEELIQMGIFPTKDIEVEVDYDLLIKQAADTVSGRISEEEQEEWLNCVKHNWSNVKTITLGKYKTMPIQETGKHHSGMCLEHTYTYSIMPYLCLPLSCLYIKTKETEWL